MYCADAQNCTTGTVITLLITFFCNTLRSISTSLFVLFESFFFFFFEEGHCVTKQVLEWRKDFKRLAGESRMLLEVTHMHLSPSASEIEEICGVYF